MKITNAFTVDLEDWFQGLTSTSQLVERWPLFESRVIPATNALLEILGAYQVQATFFVLGYIADQYPALVERIAAAGHEIGIHGYHHRFVSRLTPDEFARDLERSISAVERITGGMPLGHRAPYFSINANTPWVFGLLQGQGLRYDSSFFPTRNMLYGYPGAPRFPHRLDGHDLIEFPLSTVRLAGVNWPIAGGFYLRTWPYAVTRWGISHLNRQGQPGIMYVHPWELDVEQRYNRVTLRERITHYYGRQRLEEKLHRLFRDFEFSSLRTLLDMRHLQDAPGDSAAGPSGDRDTRPGNSQPASWDTDRAA
jgi:polysaccharide deacetylase family protein (PEP-CTERM system associated)